ncbi:Uncharacterized protein MLTONO_3206 [Mesorhizobium loti]|nr:Uncharacterized protein MLTONO_3206 [Mesorhizobium loti]
MAAVFELLPALSNALAVKPCAPSDSAAVVNVQVLPVIVAAPRSVLPSNTCTEATPLLSLTVPESASVLSLVRPPLLIVVVSPVLVPIVELIVSIGAVVSTVALIAAVVVLLPALSTALAVKLCAPSDSAAVVSVQVLPVIVAAPRSVLPSNTCTEATPLASLTVPDSASVLSLVRPPLLIVVVSPVLVPIVEPIVSIGAVSSTVTEWESEAAVELPTFIVAARVYVPSCSEACTRSPAGMTADHVPFAATVAV